MAVVVSRVKGGSIQFTASQGTGAGTAADYSCQFTSVDITPGDTTGNAGDQNYVLCGDLIPASASGGGFDDKLNFTIVSDHNVTAGLVAFSWAHRGEVVAFTFIPAKTPDEAGGSSQSWSGTVIMQPLTVGGEVQGDLRITGSLSIQSLTPPSGFGTGYAPQKGFAAPGSVFPPETGITGSDTTNAGKLSTAGYVAIPTTAWLTGQKIMISTFAFHWDGAKWAAGAAS